MPQRNHVLPRLVRPRLDGLKSTEPKSTTLTPITNEIFEIEPAPLGEEHSVSTPTKLQIKNQQKEIEEKIKNILKSPEIIYAVVATMVENIAHNDPNKFQNKQALKILEELSKESTNQDPFQDILKLAEFAKDRKTLDRNYSLAADSIRLIAGAIVLSSSIYESSKKVDDSEVGIAHEISVTAQALSAGTQIIASLKTSYEGYQASIVGHFAEELSDAFESVANKLASKLGESKQDCSDPNHEHAKTGQQEGDCDHTHVSHAGASARHLGTALNVISMGISASSALHRVINFINKNTVGHLYTSISALTAPIFSIAGKASSVKAAEIRKDEIKEKISKSQEAISKIYTTILDKVNKTKTKTKRVDVYFPQFVKDAIKLALVTIGKEAEEKTKEKRSKSGIKMDAKKFLTYMKDRVYGAPFNVVTYLRPNGQTQNFKTQTDLEQQNRKGTKWDLDLSKIKAEIGLDKIESCNERLEAFLKQNSSSSEPENTGTLRAKVSQELSIKGNPSTKVRKPKISGSLGVLNEDLGLWGAPN